MRFSALCAAILTVGSLYNARLHALPAESPATAGAAIAPQPLIKALDEFVVRTGMQVVYRSELAADVHSKGADSGLSPEKMLEQLLRDTGLRFEFINSNTVAIRGPEGSKVSQAGRKQHFLVLAQNDATAGAQSRSASPQNKAGADTQPAGDSVQPDDKLQEIVVTAQKREQRLQDVPISISVVSANEINRRGLVSAEDYLRAIPGVNQTTRPQGQAIIIRGIETSPQSQNFSSGTTVATYFGETPTTNTAGTGGDTNIDIKLVDIERVEVLRGPQGTAFGNSALGGAVRTIPIAPKLDRFEGRVAANYLVTSGSGGDDHMGQAILNIPIVKDKLAVRAVAYRYDNSGYYRNVAGSDPAFQAGPVTRYGAQAFAVDDENAGASRFTGGRIAALFQATDALKFSFSYLKQVNEMDGMAYADAGTYKQTTFQIAPEDVDRGQKQGFIDTDISLANVNMEYDLGWADLMATYSNTRSGTDYGYPISLGGLDWALSLGLDSTHREQNAEVRITTKLQGAWNFLAGLYGEKLDDDYDLDYYWFGDPAANIACGLCRGQRFTGLYFDRRDLKQKAVFGEASWEFLPGLTLTGGVRAYKYDRTVGISSGGPLFGGGTATAAAADAAGVPADASGTSLRSNLSYKPNSETLIYASWSQGFRLGRPQPGLPSGSCDRDGDGILDGSAGTTIASTRNLASDEVDSYELGTKFSLLDRRVTIAADIYRIDWSGVPFRVLAPATPAGCGLAYNANAGSARSEGIEFQANLFVTDALRFDAGTSWVRARLTEDAPGLNPPGFEGDRLPGSPKVNANLGMQYELDIAGHRSFLRADSTYVGSFYGNLQETVGTRAGGYVKIDATVGIEFRNLDVQLFARNLTNEDNFTWRDVVSRNQFFGYRLRPRSIGLQVGYTFR